MGKMHLLSLDSEALGDFTADLGEPRFRARQIREWMLHHLETDFERMTNLGKKLVEKLKETAEASILTVRTIQESKDGTRKWALATQDGHVFEMVLIPTENRRSLCVSSQIGCAMG